MPTVAPSASTQMVRVCLPSTFMDSRGAVLAPLCALQTKPVIARALLLAAPAAILQGSIRDTRGARRPMSVDYEAEYNNRARVPEHPEIFARWERDAAAYRERMKAEENAELGLAYGAEPAPDRRPVLSRRHRPHAARAVHPRRLLALARSLDLQPHVGRAERARRRGRGRGLRSLPAGDDRADHRPDPHRLPVPVAPLRPAPDGLRPFGRRASRRLHAGDRLEAARSEGAGRSRAGRLFDLRPVRSQAADRDRDERRLQAQRAEAPRRSRRCGGRCRAGACSTRWSAARSRPSSCARAASSRTTGASAASRRATRRCRARTISPWSIRLSDPNSAMTARCAALAARCAKVDK